MSAIGQVYYKVIDRMSGTITSSNIPIYAPTNIVTAFGANKFTKLGVQAPPGTTMVINNSKTIMIGQNGIYELDDGIDITSLYFNKPVRYEKDVSASNTLIEEGQKAITAANLKRDQAIKALGDPPPKPEPEDSEGQERYFAYTTAYNSIQETFLQEYEAGYQKLQQGINGVYRLPNPTDISAKENYDDLFNVIIDFIYE